jgi:pimeloyl-ACP methyl ester carboxylesterase
MKRFVRLALVLLGVIVTALGALIGLAWAPDVPPAALTERWATPPSQFITLDGLSVHLRDEGPRDDAQPIVLLHGTSASLHTWDGWADALKPSRRVIRVDLPGFGFTGPAADNDYRIERYVRFVGALYDHLELKHSVLVGNSLGGGIAWHAALADPARISALVLIDAGGYPSTASSMPIAFRLAGIPALAPIMSNILPRQMIASSLRNVYGDPTLVSEALIERYYDMARREGNRGALVERFKQMTWGGDVDRIRQIRQPTLILWGEKDRLIPPDHADRFAHDIPRNQLVKFADLGHVPHEENPAQTVAALRDFLAHQAILK